METANHITYLDNNASTQVDKRVLEAMMPFLISDYANASSIHQFGIKTNEAVSIARTQVSDLIGAQPKEIIFTSGATEAINLALKGIAETSFLKGKHIITVSTEHNATLDSCRYLESRGYDLTYLSVTQAGLIDLNHLKSALRSDTILVSVMYVNNETGIIQPIKEISKIVHANRTLFMSDTTQAIGKISVNVQDLGIDLLCMSGHKFYAPKGVGALYINQDSVQGKLSPIFHGGGHERGHRSGTLNVPGIVALGKACEISNFEMNSDTVRILAFRNKLELELLKYPKSYVNGSIANRIFNVSNICFPGIDANVVIGRMKNVAVSNGAACSSAVIEPSHVLKSMGLSDDDALASIRFSFGKFNTKSDIDIVKDQFFNYTLTSL